jgi:outer membrane protein
MRFIFVLMLAVLVLPAFGKDLVDVYRLSLLNDPTFEVARYTLKAEEERLPQARSGLLPKINLSGTNNLSQVENKFSNSAPVDRDVHAWNWSLKLTQPLLNLEQYQGYKEAELSVDRARAQYQLERQDLILRVIQAYFGVMSSAEEIKVIEKQVMAAEEQLRKVKAGFEDGMMAISDVLEGKANLDMSRSDLVVAKSKLDTKKSELEKIIDVVPESLSGLMPDAEILPPNPDNQQYWVDLAKRNSWIVHVARFGLFASEASVRKFRSVHAPTLDLVMSWGENYSSGSASIPTDYATSGSTGQIGLQFNVPLYEGGATSSRVAEAMANKYRSGAELDVSIRQASADAKQAFTSVVNGVAQIVALQTAMLSGKSMMEESRMGFDVGLYDNTKVLDSEQKYYEANRDLIKIRYETLFQCLKLKAAVGGLTEQDLVETNSMLVH